MMRQSSANSMKSNVRSFARPTVGNNIVMASMVDYQRQPTTMQIYHDSLQARAHGTAPQRMCYSFGRGTFRYPTKNAQPIDSDYQRSKTFYTKSRDQWDYNRIDENLTKQSEFGNMEGRDMFDGPREYDYNKFHKHPIGKVPKDVKQLWEYFDEYTQDGSCPKMEAARAVQEHWDAENFYYPGESWKRNRPGFRSTPKEILNKETWYSTVHMLRNWEKVHTQGRPRSWVPRWPPPGFRLPKYPARKDICIGTDHPELFHELERFQWFKLWWGSNARFGVGEWAWLFFWWYIAYWSGRHMSSMKQQEGKTWGNSWYPGKVLVRNYGEPRDAEEGWWWQTPMDDTTYFKEPGLVWWLSECRFGWIHYEARQAELKAIHGGEIPLDKQHEATGYQGSHFPHFMRPDGRGMTHSFT